MYQQYRDEICFVPERECLHFVKRDREFQRKANPLAGVERANR
jgi:hypothetical protein